MQYVPLNIFPSAYSPQHIPLNSVVSYMSRLTIELDFFPFPLKNTLSPASFFSYDDIVIP